MKYRVEHITPNGAYPPTSYSLAPQAEIQTKNGIRVLRYLPKEKSAFMDEQFTDEEVRGEQIEIPQNGLNLDSDIEKHKPIIEFLRAYPREESNADKLNIKPAYRVVELDAKAKKEAIELHSRADLLVKVATFEDNALKRLAFQLGKVNEQTMRTESINVIKQAVLAEIMTDPTRVNEYLQDELRDELDLVIDALELGILAKHNPSGSVIVDDIGRTFVKNHLGNSAVRDAAIALRQDKGKYRTVRDKVRSAKAGFEPEDENGISDEEFAKAEQIIEDKLGITGYNELVDHIVYNIKNADESPLVRKGNFYIVKGMDDEPLKTINPNGDAVIGKEGAEKTLKDERFTYEKQLKVELSKLL